MLVLQLFNIPLRGVRLLKVGPSVVQTASITGRNTRGGPLKLPQPFPYETKKFYWYHGFLDSTMVKLSQENAKIIAVEGPIGVGKSAFCKALAEEFDMRYIPEPTMDILYLLPSGYDLRKHDDELPEAVRSYDHKNFCVDPKNVKAGNFQIEMMYLRFHQYLDAICHLLNTGQGVIMERNYYSDYVFMKAMYENKFVSKAVYDAYQEILKNTSCFLPNPHLIVYLDIPVPVVQERIKTRNYTHEQNSPALTTSYLKSLEVGWKQDYLKEASKNSEILIYDWTDGGDVDVVIDDIENIDFDIMRKDKKFLEWWFSRIELSAIRKRLTNNRFYYDMFFYHPFHEVDELYIPAEARIAWSNLIESIPECKYDIGYNYHMGDSIFKILFKMGEEGFRKHKFYMARTSGLE